MSHPFAHRASLNRQRGTVYLAVLGVAVLIAIIGLAGLAAAGLQAKMVQLDQSVANAATLAQSYADVSILRMQKDPLWRSGFVNDTWTSDEVVGDARLSIKLVDLVDNSLTDNAADPFRLYARATVGNAVRIASVELQPIDPLSPSIALNPGFESGTSSWFGNGCTISADTSNVRTGGGALLVTNRSAAYAGPAQDAKAYLSSSGTNYTTEVWVRMLSGSARVRVTLQTTSVFLLTNQTAMTPWVTVNTNWTRVHGTASPSWVSLLTSAYLFIETNSGTADFRVDDLMIYPTNSPNAQVKIQVVPGTWRREMQY